MGTVEWSALTCSLAFQGAGSLPVAARLAGSGRVERIGGRPQRPEEVVRISTTYLAGRLQALVEAERRLLAGEEAACVDACPPDA
jgi:hypothetical protein